MAVVHEGPSVRALLELHEDLHVLGHVDQRHVLGAALPLRRRQEVALDDAEGHAVHVEGVRDVRSVLHRPQFRGTQLHGVVHHVLVEEQAVDVEGAHAHHAHAAERLDAGARNVRQLRPGDVHQCGGNGGDRFRRGRAHAQAQHAEVDAAEVAVLPQDVVAAGHGGGQFAAVADQVQAVALQAAQVQQHLGALAVAEAHARGLHGCGQQAAIAADDVERLVLVEPELQDPRVAAVQQAQAHHLCRHVHVRIGDTVHQHRIAEGAGDEAPRTVVAAVLDHHRQVVHAIGAGQLQRGLLLVAHDDHARDAQGHLVGGLHVRVRVVPAGARRVLHRVVHIPGLTGHHLARGTAVHLTGHQHAVPVHVRHLRQVVVHVDARRIALVQDQRGPEEVAIDAVGQGVDPGIELVHVVIHIQLKGVHVLQRWRYGERMELLGAAGQGQGQWK